MGIHAKIHLETLHATMEQTLNFYRNSLKFTNTVDFHAPELCQIDECSTVLARLKFTRNELVQAFHNFCVSHHELVNKYNSYVTLLLGLVNAPDRGDKTVERLGPIGARNGNANTVFQSMRYVFAFRWSDSLEASKSIDK